MKHSGGYFIGIIIILTAVWCAGCGSRMNISEKEVSDAGCCRSSSETDVQTSSNNRHLVQTTTFREEYEGMVRCGGTDIIPLKLPDTEAAYKKVKAGIVKINTGSLYGSGVIWKLREREIIIISNRHLLETWDEESLVSFYGGTAAGGRLLGLSDKYDLGFISVDTKSLSYENLVYLRAVQADDKAYARMESGETLFTAGSADGVGKNMYEGTFQSGWWYIKEFDSNMILGFCYGKPGMSGGGTFDAYGNFIGMISGGTGGDEIVSIPVTLIMEEYNIMEQE